MLFNAAEKGITYSDYWRRHIPKINKLRLSGCEPTIGKEHLLSLLQFVKESKYPLFIARASTALIQALALGLATDIVLATIKKHVQRRKEKNKRVQPDMCRFKALPHVNFEIYQNWKYIG